GRRDVHRRTRAGELLPPAHGLRRSHGGHRRSRGGAREAPGRHPDDGSHPGGDPADAHAFRPRRRRRTDREGHGRSRLLPRTGASRAGRHHGLRPLRGLRPVSELGRGAHRQGRGAPEPRGPRDRRALHPGPLAGPRHLRLPRPWRAGLRRRALRELRRPHRPSRGRSWRAHGLHRDAARRLSAGNDRAPGPHGHDDARPGAGDEPVPAVLRV
ncbi:MAG: MBL-fold metallo-hydrolase superfamily, partial [uncultured Solirubrobacteraceae bacterium]